MYVLHVGGTGNTRTESRQWQIMLSKVAVVIFQNHILFQNLAIPYQEVKSIFASGFN